MGDRGLALQSGLARVYGAPERATDGVFALKDTAKRRQVQRLRASLVGVCRAIRFGNWVPSAFGVQ